MGLLLQKCTKASFFTKEVGLSTWEVSFLHNYIIVRKWVFNIISGFLDLEVGLLF